MIPFKHIFINITGFFLSSIVTHYRLKGVKDITVETLVDSTKSLQDSIHDRSSFVVTEMKEMLNDIDTKRNRSGEADTAGDISKESADILQAQQQVFLDQHNQQVDANLQQHLDHLKQESTRIEQLLEQFDQKLAATISTVASQLQQTVIPSQDTTTPPPPVVPPTSISEYSKVQANSTTIDKDTVPVVDSKVDHQLLDSNNDIQAVAVPQNVVVQYAPLLAVLGSGVLLIYSMFNE